MLRSDSNSNPLKQISRRFNYHLDYLFAAPPSGYLKISNRFIRELKYREALLLPRHVEFWTSGASSDRRYFSDKQKLSGCPHVIVYMCAHGWNELPILVLYVTWSHTILLINTLIVHTWYRKKRSSETVNKELSDFTAQSLNS